MSTTETEKTIDWILANVLTDKAEYIWPLVSPELLMEDLQFAGIEKNLLQALIEEGHIDELIYKIQPEHLLEKTSTGKTIAEMLFVRKELQKLENYTLREAEKLAVDPKIKQLLNFTIHIEKQKLNVKKLTRDEVFKLVDTESDDVIRNNITQKLLHLRNKEGKTLLTHCIQARKLHLVADKVTDRMMRIVDTSGIIDNKQPIIHTIISYQQLPIIAHIVSKKTLQQTDDYKTSAFSRITQRPDCNIER